MSNYEKSGDQLQCTAVLECSAAVKINLTLGYWDFLNMLLFISILSTTEQKVITEKTYIHYSSLYVVGNCGNQVFQEMTGVPSSV
jgi:hypothetical protein